MIEDILDSSGNIFIDLGFPPDEAAVLQMRADLMTDIRKFIECNTLTQVSAAEMLGVSQSRISDLVRGKWEKFSLEMLITLATRAGMHVSVNIAASTTPELKIQGLAKARVDKGA
ncbi:MAG: XRE family transcriptional regulator [Desulfobacteraceae bacterium]